jgi:hypothetical protein
MCVNYREASQRGRSCPRRANAEAPLIEAIQQAVQMPLKSESTTCAAGGQRCRSTTIRNRYGRAALYLCRELTEHDATRIAERFGRKSAVVKQAVESVRQVMDSDRDLASRLASATQRLQAGLSRREEDDVVLFAEQLAQHHRHK